jgi:hypothetical protein
MYLLKVDTDDLVQVRIIQRNNNKKTSNTLIPWQLSQELFYFVKMVEKYFQKNKKMVKIQENLLKYPISFKLKQLFNRQCVEAAPVLWHDTLATQQTHHKIINFKLLERLYYQCSICDPAMQVLDEVPRSNSVKLLEDSLGP